MKESVDMMPAIDSVLTKYGASNKNKHRAVVYYMLAKHFKMESAYNK
jgi:hypothetical protein